MGLFGKKKEKEQSKATTPGAYVAPKEFKPSPQQQEWLTDNVLRRAGVKKITIDNCDQIISYIQNTYEQPLRARLKGKVTPELKFINDLMRDLSFFMDSQEIF
ncbi:MAG: hypothetical protein PUG65_01115 [Firmicutes bacterium]|nr:hypothetical protein [Bacillota bacterium]MDY4559766.1 hypothetical protein [Eubacteriales bacterium]